MRSDFVTIPSLESAVPRELLENSPGNLVAPFRRLIRISCRTQRNTFSRFTPQLLPQQLRGMLLYVDFLFELRPSRISINSCVYRA